MKKMILVAIFLIVVLVGISMLMRQRMGGVFMGKQLSGGDLVVVNDSSETFSTAFTINGKLMSQVVHSGGKATGGKGVLRIFVPNKSGIFELQYSYPRPAGQPAEISLTQVLDAVHNLHLGQELDTREGTIDDIKVSYEQVRDLGPVVY